MEQWSINCCKCGAYILTEQKDGAGSIKCIRGSYRNGFYDGIRDVFYCNECSKKLKKGEKRMNKAVKEAMQLIEESEWPDTQIPDLDIGDVVKLYDVWDGNGETGVDPYDYHIGEEHSYSHMIDEENGINYLFRIVQCGETIKDVTVQIIDIYII